jgi:hypothetical protein
MNTHPTYRISQVIAASDEYTDPIFRARPGALTDEQIDAAVKAWFDSKIDFHEPNFLRARMRAAIAATGDPS